MFLRYRGCGDDSETKIDVRRDAVSAAVSYEALAAQASTYTVYDDSPENAFKDGGWGTYNLKSTAYVHSGRYAAMLTPNNWDGLQFSHSAIGASGYSALTFYINGGSSSGQTIWAGVTDTKNNRYYTAITNYLPSRRITANLWQQVTLPLADIGAAGVQIASVFIMTGIAQAQPNVYVDDIALVVAGGGTTTGSTTGTTTGGPTTGGTGTGSTTAGTTTGGTTTGGTTGTSSGTTTAGTSTSGRRDDNRRDERRHHLHLRQQCLGQRVLGLGVCQLANELEHHPEQCKLFHAYQPHLLFDQLQLHLGCCLLRQLHQRVGHVQLH